MAEPVTIERSRAPAAEARGHGRSADQLRSYPSTPASCSVPHGLINVSDIPQISNPLKKRLMELAMKHGEIPQYR